jgi:hypothetical protein
MAGMKVGCHRKIGMLITDKYLPLSRENVGASIEIGGSNLPASSFQSTFSSSAHGRGLTRRNHLGDRRKK